MNEAITWPLVRNRIRRGMNNHTFGMVRRNADGSRRPHQGWDFEADIGETCFAIADGTIELVRNGGAYGRQIILRFAFDFDGDGDADTLFAAYCHLSRVDVAQGQKVRKGQPIGLTGDSGNARGMAPADRHLHFEIRTKAIAGRGLANRFSPLAVFGECPLARPVGRMAA
ncbi:M23 family metallopeptidase [Qipengyuania citrea]|uniref:M23 family metallopeptidase n=1 Tax=Qipengyuania citrea TaxID=225971 RepID=UPI00209E7035|nr:M23 family metallopeptidase [Qipengyuania citrea]MCP2016845.1 murein DD-endopeptidase MepM/ murein hydrolase activator NlpD [Qipengyuania citrea]